MTHISIRSLSFLFVLPFILGTKTTVCAQSGENGLLWEITGNGLKKTSYLYGTIHIRDNKVFAFDQIVEKKLESCKAFAMEIVMDEINQLDLLQSMKMTDTSLDKLLSPDEYKKVESVLKQQAGMDIGSFNKLKPFVLYSQLSQSNMPQEKDVPLDMYLLEIARANKMKVVAVEKLEEQLAAINSISVQEQAKMVVKLVNDDSAGMSDYDNLVEIYLLQDLESMIALTDDEGMPEDFVEQFLVARNKAMAERIIGHINEQSTFTAIGAAHLGGIEGVISLLRAAGYELKAIPFTFKN